MICSLHNKKEAVYDMINILVVDDHDLVRTGISRILNDVDDFKVVGEVGDGESAVDYCRKNTPDVVLMDNLCRALAA